MHLAVEEGVSKADSFLGGRTRTVFRWYAKGFLTETEALRLIGAACLGWTQPARQERARGRVRLNARDAV